MVLAVHIVALVESRQSALPETSVTLRWRHTEQDAKSYPMTRDEELWGMALWVEKNHGEEGWFYIAQQQDRLLAEGDFGGMKLWRDVDERFKKLQAKASAAKQH